MAGYYVLTSSLDKIAYSPMADTYMQYLSYSTHFIASIWLIGIILLVKSSLKRLSTTNLLFYLCFVILLKYTISYIEVSKITNLLKQDFQQTNMLTLVYEHETTGDPIKLVVTNSTIIHKLSETLNIESYKKGVLINSTSSIKIRLRLNDGRECILSTKGDNKYEYSCAPGYVDFGKGFIDQLNKTIPTLNSGYTKEGMVFGNYLTDFIVGF